MSEGKKGVCRATHQQNLNLHANTFPGWPAVFLSELPAEALEECLGQSYRVVHKPVLQTLDEEERGDGLGCVLQELIGHAGMSEAMQGLHDSRVLHGRKGQACFLH